MSLLSRHPRAWIGWMGVLAIGVHGWGSPDPSDGILETPSFRYDILPTLSRQGCATAYCHGAATGQGGFKLSLFGSEPRQDYFAIRSALDGRRIDLVRPEQSLLLRKPTRQVAHGGGRKLPLDSDGYRRVLAWIRQGAKWASPGERELHGLRIESADSSGTHALRAFATFGSGATRGERDVTELARWSSSDGRVVQVAVGSDKPLARIEPTGPGRAHVFARFGNQTARWSVVRPFGAGAGTVGQAHREDAGSPTAGAGSGQERIDRAWRAGLDALGLQPAPAASPLRVLRRAALDLVGRPPTLAEMRRFENARGTLAQRVRSLAEDYVQSDEFAEVFGHHLAEWLELPDPLAFAGRRDGRGDAAEALRRRVVDRLRAGQRVPELLREMLQRREHVYRVADPRDRAELFGRTVLGIRIGCARCHNHPEDRWTRTDHQEFSALFADTTSVDARPMTMTGLFDPATGERVFGRLPEGLTSKPLPARLRGDVGHPARTVEWLALDGGLTRLYRNLANRTVQALIGRGLVEPVDDHRRNNPATDERLMAVLAERMAESGGDLREFVLGLVGSEFYAVQSDALATGPAAAVATERRYLARRSVRALGSRAFLRAAVRALGLEFRRTVAAPASPLARQLEVLHGDALAQALAGGDHLVDAIADFGAGPNEQLVDLWRMLLTRAPRPEEVARFAPRIEQAESRRQALRDLAFAILASREFGSVR